MKEIRVWRGRHQFNEFLDAIRAEPFGTVSPGGACQILEVSRQAVHKMINKPNPDVTSYWFYEYPWSQRPGIEVSVADVVIYAYRTGRLKLDDSVPLSMGLKVREVVDNIKPEVYSK